MEAAGTHVASTDSAMIQARAGLDTVSEHGNEVVAISRQIADGTRQQSAAGNEIAVQLEEIVGGIEQTSASLNGVTLKAALMKDSSAQLRQLIGYFQIKN